MADTPAPATPNAPPAPDLSALYGDSGKLVAAPATAPAVKPVQPTMSAAPAPSLVQRATAAFKEGIPLFNSKFAAASAGYSPEGQAKVAAGQLPSGEQTPQMQIITPEKAMTAKEQEAHPILSTAAQAAGGLTSPENVGIMVGTGGLGELPGAGGALVPKLISLGYSAQAIKGAYDQIPEFKKAMDAGDEKGAERAFTHIVLDTAMGVAAGQHATEGAGAHLAETGRNFAASVREEVPGIINAKAPEGSTEAGFAKLGGKKVGQTKPDIEIRKEGPDWDRTHSAYDSNGKKVGSVGYKVDAQGRAQIYGSNVDPALRGQGIGQKLYGSVIDEAPTKGAKRITSDSTNTTPDANRVWQKIGEKGAAPVEEITHPNGKPGYQIDFQKAAPKTEEAAVDPLEQLHGDTGKKVSDGPTNPGAPEVSEGANKFNAENGRPPINVELKKVSEPFAKELADHFEELQHDPSNPEVQKTYKALKSDIDDQWNYATQKMGMKFEPWNKEGQPYANSREMSQDVKDNHHLYFYQGGDMPTDHPMAETDAKTGLTYNDKLRAVHDLFGHAAEGHQFGPTGEENAYQVHRQMFSPEAIPALTGETRAQNSWVNYGPHLRGENGEVIGKGEPGYVAPKDRPFAEQKAVALDPRFTEAEPKSANADTTAKSANAYNSEWHQTAGAAAAKDEAGGIDPRTGKSDSKGIGVEVMPELRQALDHAPTAEDFKNFYDQNKAIFDKHPELRVGWDNNSAVPGGHEINVGAVGDEAARVGKKLDQKSAFNIEKGEIIPTGGTGLRTSFPNYSLDERMKDLKGENPSNVKNFEHLSEDVYSHLEPDEREYLKGNKLLQRNVMKQYHSIAPSVAETTNAMQAGAALGGWWKRYIDIFQDLAEGGKQQPAGKPLYHYTTKPFESFDPMRGGIEGDFGTHLGTLEQAHGRMQGAGESLKSTENMVGEDQGAHVRPVYADLKNPVRIQDDGEFRPDQVASQLRDRGILSKSEYKKLTEKYAEGMVRPEELRDVLEKKGYDSLVYLNRVEGLPVGTGESLENSGPMTDDEFQKHTGLKGSDSYIALRNEQIQPKYSAELLANTVGPSHAEVLKQWHAALSGNKSVEDANNLAWHSYADWLDAGKPTDRKSIDDIIRKNGAQPEGSGKKGNAAISDTLDKKGRILSPGLDTTKMFNLVNSPEMKGERPFSGDVFNEDQKNPLMGTTEGARKIPSMGATVAGKGNLNRLVIDAHIRDFYGHKSSGGPAAQYIADSAHLRQAAEALGLKGGEGQEQLWGTVLGLKTLLKEGLTPEEAGKKLNADVINKIGKDYAEVISNDPEITKPGGILDRLKERYGVGRGSAGLSSTDSQASGPGADQSGPAGGETPTDTAQLAKTAERIRGQISPSKIKTPAPPEDEGDASFNFDANAEPPDKPQGSLFGPPEKKSKGFNALDLIRGLDSLKKPAKK
jgi:predicted GNAT family acetyltransferase